MCPDRRELHIAAHCPTTDRHHGGSANHRRRALRRVRRQPAGRHAAAIGRAKPVGPLMRACARRSSRNRRRRGGGSWVPPFCFVARLVPRAALNYMQNRPDLAHSGCYVKLTHAGEKLTHALFNFKLNIEAGHPTARGMIGRDHPIITTLVQITST